MIASVVFMLSAFGLYSALASFEKIRNDTTRELEAVYIGSGILDELRLAVDANDWANNVGDLRTGFAHNRIVGNVTVNWTVVNEGPDRRKLTMTINY